MNADLKQGQTKFLSLTSDPRVSAFIRG